jgi:hypothetical protein
MQNPLPRIGRSEERPSLDGLWGGERVRGSMRGSRISETRRARTLRRNQTAAESKAGGARPRGRGLERIQIRPSGTGRPVLCRLCVSRAEAHRRDRRCNSFGRCGTAPRPPTRRILARTRLSGRASDQRECRRGGEEQRPAEPENVFPSWPNSAKKGMVGQAAYAPVAQLDRALPSEGKGQRFESPRARHSRTNQRELSARVRRPLLRRSAPGRLSGR